MPTMPPEAHH